MSGLIPGNRLRHSDLLSLGARPIRSLTAFRSRCLQPMYRSVVWTLSWLRRNWICSSRRPHRDTGGRKCAADHGERHRSNKDEGTFVSSYCSSPFFGLGNATAQQFAESARRRFGPKASAFLEMYPTGSEEEARASQLSAMRDEADGTFGTGLWHRPRPEAAPACIISCTSPPLSFGRPNWRAAHGDEIAYAFDTPIPAWTEVDHALADAMSSYWVNFAKNGNPTRASCVAGHSNGSTRPDDDPGAEGRGGADARLWARDLVRLRCDTSFRRAGEVINRIVACGIPGTSGVQKSSPVAAPAITHPPREI